MDINSPAIVLLADILPCLIVQAIAPYFMVFFLVFPSTFIFFSKKKGYIPYFIRVIFIVITAIGSFLFPAFFVSFELKMTGVCFSFN